MTWTVESSSEEQTLALGKHLGRLLKQPALVLLQGDLGAGKSVFARGVARGLGVDPQTPITSPTFTLMNHYQGRLELYHFDLYRLSEPDELIEIGFDDYAYGSGVALVEWPERLGNERTQGLWLKICYQDNQRRSMQFSAQGEFAEDLLSRFRQGWQG